MTRLSRALLFLPALVLACAAGRRGSAAPPPCSLITTDVSGWRPLRSDVNRVQFQYPPAYVHKLWENSSSEAMARQIHLWRDDRPASGITVRLIGKDSAGIMIDPTGSVTRCEIMTQSGPATVVLQETLTFTGSTARAPQYSLDVLLPSRHAGQLVHFQAWTRDTLHQKEQLAIVRTLRLLESEPRQP